MSWLIKISMPFEEHEWQFGIDTLPSKSKRAPFKTLPKIPSCLVVVDIQEEFNQCIDFECQEFLTYLNACNRKGTEFHIVYDYCVGKKPTIYNGLNNVHFYEKCYGADPHGGVIAKDLYLAGIEQRISPAEMDEGEIYFDPEAQMDIYRSYGHEYQHIYPDMVDLVKSISGKSPTVIGGHHYGCLRDILCWFDMNNVQYTMEHKFIY